MHARTRWGLGLAALFLLLKMHVHESCVAVGYLVRRIRGIRHSSSLSRASPLPTMPVRRLTPSVQEAPHPRQDRADADARQSHRCVDLHVPQIAEPDAAHGAWRLGRRGAAPAAVQGRPHLRARASTNHRRSSRTATSALACCTGTPSSRPATPTRCLARPGNWTSTCCAGAERTVSPPGRLRAASS